MLSIKEEQIRQNQKKVILDNKEKVEEEQDAEITTQFLFCSDREEEVRLFKNTDQYKVAKDKLQENADSIEVNNKGFANNSD